MKSRNSDGFALPTVLISSIIMLIVMLSAVSSTVAIRVSLNSQYYNRLAQAAGDAGTAYAKACLLRNSNTPTWSTAKPLMPNTDCNGDLLPGFTCGDGNALTEARCSVSIRDKMTTSFIVGSPRVDSGGKAVAVNAAGYTRLYRGSGVNVEPWRQYSGSVLLYTMPKLVITGIGAITGTAQMGQVLTAGAVTPASATVSYQWQSSATSGGTYTNIAGATSSTYTPNLASAGKYLKVVVTGSGGYTGTQTSAATATVVATDSNWVIVGAQVWASKNLNVGTRIAGITAQTNNSTIEKYCYSDTEANCGTYGGLYQWDEAMQYVTIEGVQGICPAGSHIPTDTDWKALEMHLGMTQAQADLISMWRGTDQGTKLKASGSSGLNVLVGGYRDSTGSFYNLGTSSSLWTGTQTTVDASIERSFWTTETGVRRGALTKNFGLAVRCLRN